MQQVDEVLNTKYQFYDKSSFFCCQRTHAMSAMKHNVFVLSFLYFTMCCFVSIYLSLLLFFQGCFSSFQPLEIHEMLSYIVFYSQGPTSDVFYKHPNPLSRIAYAGLMIFNVLLAFSLILYL